MNITVTTNYGKLPALFARIRDKEPAKAAARVWSTYMLSRLALYSPIRRRKQPPKSDKQRRFLHWAYRTGRLSSPYRRTGAMAEAWQTTYATGGVSATISNATAAARYTKGSNTQSFYHRGNWRTVDDDLKRYGPEASKRAAAAVGETL